MKGNLIPVAEAVKTFGRADFISYVTENESKFISRKHFTISREADGFYIVDENSANGTKLNGVEIKGQGKKPLKNGDKILVADTLELVFVAGG
ncbi:MAG: FHA domain-containing protein [Candidatus Hadarchaeales archaeon]